MIKRVIVFTVAAVALSNGIALADAGREAILAGFSAQAKQADPAFKGFSAAAGKSFWTAVHTGGGADTPSCTTCHTKDARKAGQTRAGKAIDAMAVSVMPARFTDQAKVDKWFGRNCKSVLGRECTAQEKGDVITYLSGL